MEQIFTPLPPVPDHPRLEEEILQWWEDEQVFQQLREQNRGGPKFGFMDGPITANAPAGVHHGLGRTLKDVFQRYKALRGHDLRYQNGFDSQGLHVEVQVEKGLGLNSKREIEEYGIGEFARRCREFVAHFAGIQTEQSKRLGMWMDWENSYFTFSDTNIEYIWRFLKNVHDRGWLYMGHRSTQWCPRCGTSLSKHEQAGDENYEELEHPSLFVRFPLVEREGEALVVWTTTPWTLPANVAAAVKPDAQYGSSENGDWVSVDVFPDGDYVERLRGEDLVGLHYRAPFDDYPAQEGVEHRVIPWDDVALDEGTGIVHIAPGAGAEDFELSRLHGLPVLAPIDESGRFLPGYGEFEGRTTDAVAEPVLEWLHEHELLVEAGTIRHRYPVCWRCRTPLVFRVVDDWFISAAEIRQLMLDGNDEVAWQPPQYKKRMDDWLRNMGDWNISRRRYFGLPLPFYSCDCGRLNVIGSRAELDERAVSGLDQLEELHRPWIDEVTIRCEDCGAELTRIEEVGDAWLDAGIVHFSTLGWQNPEWVPEGNATGAARGVTHADLPDHAYWEKWFPADWVSEGRAQIRLWFYSQCFMAMALVGRQPYQSVLTYENLLDETGREMHKSWGNAIELNEALDRMGADVMRWLYCEQNPSQELRFGYSLADDVKRRLLTFWNSVSFFVTYANIAGFDPAKPAGELRPLDGWLTSRTSAFVSEATASYERYWTPGEIDETLNAEVAAVRQVVELGRQARAASRLKLRQPLRRVVVAGADGARSHADEIAEELRVKQVEFGDVEASELRVKPNLPLLGPKLGPALRDVREALARGEFDELDGGRFRVGEHELSPDEVLVERTGKEGWAVASTDGVTVALDTALDPELELEALVLDLIHQINAMRKEQGLELTDRIRITLPAAQSELLRHEDWIKQETLAVEIEIDGASAEPRIAKA